MDKSKWGVHESHCCPIHGCKYGDLECPVALHLTPADGMCEDCYEMWADYDSYDIITTKGERHYSSYREFFDALNSILSWGEGSTIIDLKAYVARTTSLLPKKVQHAY